MSPCGRAWRHQSRGAMAVLAWKCPRTRLPVGASALCIVVLCWLYIFPVYRLPNEKEIVQGVLQQGTAWRRNQTAAKVFRYSVLPCPYLPRSGDSVTSFISPSCPWPFCVISKVAFAAEGPSFLILQPHICAKKKKAFLHIFPNLSFVQGFDWEGKTRLTLLL